LLLFGVFGLLPGAAVFPRSAFLGAIVFAGAALAVPGAEAGALVLVAVDAPGVSDLIYATKEFSCSSVTWPLKVGIMG